VVSDPKPFRIGFTQKADFQLTLLQRRALIFGESGRVARALKVMMDRMRTEARELGEPTRTMKGMRMVLRVAFQDHIRFNYGVHESEQEVIVNAVEAEPGHPLHRQE
jgi:hypothetical protein